MLSQQGLRELENQCIQEHAPECNPSDSCQLPRHGSGDTNGNLPLKVFAVTVPFYQSISRVCEQPCQKACKRLRSAVRSKSTALSGGCSAWAEATRAAASAEQEQWLSSAAASAGRGYDLAVKVSG